MQQDQSDSHPGTDLICCKDTHRKLVVLIRSLYYSGNYTSTKGDELDTVTYQQETDSGQHFT